MPASSKVHISGNNLYHVTYHFDFVGADDEADVTKLDISTLVGPDKLNAPTRVSIKEIDWDVQGTGLQAVQVEFNDGTDERIGVFSGQGFRDYRRSGGFNTGPLTGTGDIIFTTLGTVAAGDSYDILFKIRLKL